MTVLLVKLPIIKAVPDPHKCIFRDRYRASIGLGRHIQSIGSIYKQKVSFVHSTPKNYRSRRLEVETDTEPQNCFDPSSTRPRLYLDPSQPCLLVVLKLRFFVWKVDFPRTKLHVQLLRQELPERREVAAAAFTWHSKEGALSALIKFVHEKKKPLLGELLPTSLEFPQKKF